MTFTFTFSWLLVLALVTAAVAIYDGIARLRGRRVGTVFAVVEIIAAVLLAISQFVTMPYPFTPFWFSVVLEIVLLIALFLRGSRYVWVATVVALVLNSILLLYYAGWLRIPGFLE